MNMKNSSNIDISKAISPLEASNLQIENIHHGIFECINELLIKKLKKTKSDDSEESCKAYITVTELRDLFNKKYLLAIESFWYEFESIYEKKGWEIYYNESVWTFVGPPGSLNALNDGNKETILEGTIHFDNNEK